MRYKAVIFDLDGTLVDTLEDLADCMNAVLLESGFPAHPVDAYRYFVGLGMMKLAEQASPAGTPRNTVERIASRMGERYADNWANKSRPYPGVVELLAALGSRGYRLAVLSNKPDPFTRQFAARFFPAGTFMAVMGAREGVPHKPDPAGAMLMAQAMDVPPAGIAYLGDTDTDMRTGRAAGMYTVGVSWGFRPVEELLLAGAQAIVDHPEQVLELL